MRVLSKKNLGLVLLFAGLGRYLGIAIVFALGDYEVTIAQTDKLVYLTFPLVYLFPVMGLGDHARVAFQSCV